MKENISDETIEYVGILAKLELSEEEKRRAKDDMCKILHYVDKLNELDTSDIEPLYNIFSTNNVFREDVVANENYSEEMLKNAPEHKNGAFVVPKAFE